MSVKVRLVTNRERSGEDREAIKLLKEAGAELEIISSGEDYNLPIAYYLGISYGKLANIILLARIIHGL